MNTRHATATVAILLLACSSSTTAPPVPDVAGACNILASQCHGVGTPRAKECHDLGHGGDDAKCAPRKEECLALCPVQSADDGGPAGVLADAGADARGGSVDAATDAATDACAAYCTCMQTTCATEEGYPFGDVAACLARCSAFSTEDRACFTKHCTSAKNAADKSHGCEHASGTIACH